MPTVLSLYQGNLRCQNTHVQSGTSLITDAPCDNQGKGESFSPTDLVATALGTCMMTIMGIYAKDNGFNLDGMKMEITKKMSITPRRIGRIDIVITMPHHIELTPMQKAALEEIPHTCPVCLSLNPEIEKNISFVW